ncbi:MAG TPA: hypothetical protein VK463_21200 [Desulfomonilaceae bacterium]|nr:hypothetical protein [Desulfomonilaceae bacterium]
MAQGRVIRVIRKCHELREQGKSWEEIERILPSLGADYVMKTGEPYKAETLMKMHSNNKHKILSSYEQDERHEDEPSEELRERVKGLVEDLIDRRLPEIEERLTHRLKDMIHEEISRHPVGAAEFSTERQPLQDDLPPEPTEIKREPGTKTKGRSRQNRNYERHTVTVDSNLWRLFEQDMKRRQIPSAGRMMDVILWNYYGKPALSYMIESQKPEKNSSKDPKGGSDEE